MKINNTNSKTIDFFKKNRNKFVCTGLVLGSLIIPFDEALMEEHDEKNVDQPSKQSQQLEEKTKTSISIMGKDVEISDKFYDAKDIKEQAQAVVDQLGDEEKKELSEAVKDNPEFIIRTAWKKTRNYSVGGFFKEVREYQRKVSTIKMKDSYNFPDNYESLLEFVRDNKDLDSMFEVISENEEVINVDEEKERILDTENWKMEVVGSPVIVSVKKPDVEEKKFAAGPYLAVVILLAGTKSIFYLLDEYKSYH